MARKSPFRLPSLNALLICIFAVGCVAAQQNRTIVLVRHAEKAVTDQSIDANPPLSAEGMARAERLAKIVAKYHPGAIYSSDFLRTRATAAPIARRRNLDIQIYDRQSPETLLDTISKSPSRRVVIVGHTNTLPNLINLLLKKELFKTLDESEYGTFFVVRLKKDRPPRAEVVTY